MHGMTTLKLNNNTVQMQNLIMYVYSNRTTLSQITLRQVQYADL